MSSSRLFNVYRGSEPSLRRPPAGRIIPSHALWFGILLSVVGGLYLAFLVNPFASLLSMLTLSTYLLFYTPLKRKTPLCTLVGRFQALCPR